MEPKTIPFVEDTRDGKLAARLREATRRLGPTLGFGIRIVERAGSPLKNSFSATNLWDSMQCGRVDCVPSKQGAEKLQPCYKSSLVYENICQTCNPGAEPGKEQAEIRADIPTLYVGETSRSLHERMKEHWGAKKSKKEENHMFIHHQNEHRGEEEPRFMVRAVKFYKSALSRQLGEAVRIRRRGGQGSILNSKSEYDRCRIPRLVLEEKEEEQIKYLEEDEQRELDKIMELLNDEEQSWGAAKEMKRNKLGCANVKLLVWLEFTKAISYFVRICSRCSHV